MGSQVYLLGRSGLRVWVGAQVHPPSKPWPWRSKYWEPKSTVLGVLGSSDMEVLLSIPQHKTLDPPLHVEM